jgi:DNA repair exonuclease SbcCD ATPase subunit
MRQEHERTRALLAEIRRTLGAMPDTKTYDAGRPPMAEGKNGTSTWQIVIMAGAVMLTLASQFWTLANPRDDIRTVRVDNQQAMDRLEKELTQLITKNEKRIDEVQHQLETAVETINKHLEKSVVGRMEHEEFVHREDARLNTLENQSAKMQDNLVTRAEHQTHWNESDQKFTVLNNRLDQLIQAFTGTFTIGDQLKNLQKEIDDLRVATSGVHSTLVPTTPIPSR